VPVPFHRVETPTQTIADAQLQQSSNEIWGKAAANTAQSNSPCVKAYRATLPSGQRGVEFETTVAHTPNSGTPFEARWYLGTTGVLQRADVAGTIFAAIPLSRFVNGQP
jgi:hypothetical protein